MWRGVHLPQKKLHRWHALRIRTDSTVDQPGQQDFDEWADEEIQLSIEQQTAEVKALQQDLSAGETLPMYMLDLLQEYGLPANASEPVAPSKLPILAIIGRPNTGKSTLVNKITDSYKVPFALR